MLHVALIDLATDPSELELFRLKKREELEYLRQIHSGTVDVEQTVNALFEVSDQSKAS